MTITVDFDGTIVEHAYPRIGREIPFAVDTLKMLQKEGHLLILWSVREGHLLDEAVTWCKEHGLEFYAINSNYPEETPADKGYHRKVLCNLNIDDRNIGGFPDWGQIYRIIHEKKSLSSILKEEWMSEEEPPKRTSKWKLW